MQILMPMAGLGSRFTEQGYSIPKPMIRLGDKALFQYPLMSIEFDPSVDSVTFIIRKGALDKRQINQMMGCESSFIEVDRLTAGPLDSCRKALPQLKQNEPVVILDCDYYFESSEYVKRLRDSKFSASGALFSFESDSPKYSYARAENGKVSLTAEKQCISGNALVGCYYFNTTELLQEAMRGAVQGPNGEEYVAPTYNHLIEGGHDIQLFPVKRFLSFGTPEELKASCAEIAKNPLQRCL